MTPPSLPPRALAGPRLWTDCQLGEPELLAVGNGRAAVFSSRCPGREGANEDAAAVIPCGSGRVVLAVADGLGGHPAGEEASRLVLEELRRTLETAAQRSDADLRPAILDAIESANVRLLEHASGAATTLVVAEVQDGGLRPYHVGDSLILVVSQRGRTRLQTVSHSPVGYAVESGLLDERDAMHHEHRHLISNLVGSQEMRIEVGSPLVLAPRDTVLLATDGLLDNLHGDEIVNRIRKGSLERAATALTEDSLRRMREPAPGQPSKPDDLTFVLFRHSGSGRRG